MGMYTEFYFRANIKDGEVSQWLDGQINGDESGWFETAFDDSEFFQSDRWLSVFLGGGAVYQESRTPIFRRKNPGGGEPYHNQLVLASSLKNYGGAIESFLQWIDPHLDMYRGDFLGYSLYEDSRPSGMTWGNHRDPRPDRDDPTLYFHRGD